jgi:hypothetical protein
MLPSIQKHSNEQNYRPNKIGFLPACHVIFVVTAYFYIRFGTNNPIKKISIFAIAVFSLFLPMANEVRGFIIQLLNKANNRTQRTTSTVNHNINNKTSQKS